MHNATSTRQKARRAQFLSLGLDYCAAAGRIIRVAQRNAEPLMFLNPTKPRLRLGVRGRESPNLPILFLPHQVIVFNILATTERKSYVHSNSNP